jgi:hypothetical protein
MVAWHSPALLFGTGSTTYHMRYTSCLALAPQPCLLLLLLLLFQDGDLVLMHEQERLVADKGGWRKAMFMPHPSDRGSAKFRWERGSNGCKRGTWCMKMK